MGNSQGDSVIGKPHYELVTTHAIHFVFELPAINANELRRMKSSQD